MPASPPAHALRELGLKPRGAVGLFRTNGIAYIASLLAVQQAGEVFGPIGLAMPLRRLQSVLRKIQPAAVITNDSCQPLLRSRLATLGAPDRSAWILGWTPGGGLWRQQPDGSAREDLGAPAGTESLAERPHPADGMYVMFTSGSTGEPKAILSSHEALYHFIEWEKSEVQADQSLRASNLALTTFDVSLRDLPAVGLGGAVGVPYADTRRNGALLLRWLEEKHITLMHVVPSIFRLLRKEMESAPEQKVFLPSLRFILFAGEPLYGTDALGAWKYLGDRLELLNLYGPSETTLAKAFLRITRDIADPRRMIPIGGPISGTRLFLIRDNRGVAPGDYETIQPPFLQRVFPQSEMTPSGLSATAHERSWRHPHRTATWAGCGRR